MAEVERADDACLREVYLKRLVASMSVDSSCIDWSIVVVVVAVVASFVGARLTVDVAAGQVQEEEVGAVVASFAVVAAVEH